MKSVCVFLGSNPGTSPGYTQAAETLGGLLAARKITLVYGGAKNGLMGILARSVADAGGRVVGVLPGFLKAKELAFEGLAEMFEVESMHERKAKMAELSDGFIAMPGGLGTLEEIFEVATWGQLGLHAKPVGFYNVQGYYDKLAAFLDHMVEQGFLKGPHRNNLIQGDNPAELLDIMAAFKPAVLGKWFGLEKS
ncbi:TIGR00730 family Rossman fold protein [Fundidesulfovibrio terrae]|uniref:LOG family protein n=1 Tax=Fundidesulfovibrio terrae TaxID=2922866 RepID=UPI001FB03FE2|nr:TIGR00730 family Rossman fold protein [Fundidesulfovibrio terrae]